MKRSLALAAIAALIGFADLAAEARDIRSERVRFAPGANSAVVEGSIAGYETVDYLLRARAGQYMNVSMATDNRANYFNILEPGEDNVAIFNGSLSSGGNQYEGILQESGDYKVRVYLMRSAARRNEVANYRLEMIIASAGRPEGDPGQPQAKVPAAPEDGGPRHWKVTGVSTSLNMRDAPSTRGRVVARLEPGAILSNLGCQRAQGRVWCDVQPFRGGARGYVAAEFLAPAPDPFGGPPVRGMDDSSLRAGQGDFDASGQIPCAQYRGQPIRQCDFGVARAGGGDATVVVTLPDGFRRALFFTRGEFIGADASQAGGGFQTSARKEGDLFLIRVDEERYEIPEAIIFGG